MSRRWFARTGLLLGAVGGYACFARNSLGGDDEKNACISRPRRHFITAIYRSVSPLLFLIDPETAHRATIRFYATLGSISSRCTKSCESEPSSLLKQEVLGMSFGSPVGVAAGFDKNGEAALFLGRGMLGNGHFEVGSVSALPWSGNPKPRLFRLSKSEAVINRMGLNNNGCEEVHKALMSAQGGKVPFGVNLVKTADSSIIGEAAVSDFVASFAKLAPSARWVTINVSCPNSEDGKTFEELDSFKSLMAALFAERSALGLKTPILVKLSPLACDDSGESLARMLALVEVAVSLGIDGIVLSNTVADRSKDLLLSDEDLQTSLKTKGGLSGKPILHRTISAVREVYRATAGRVPIIAVGGVASAEDAYALIRSGASLVQLYTAMVYQGPAVFSDINRGLEWLLIRDGFTNIQQVRGIDLQSGSHSSKIHLD